VTWVRLLRVADLSETTASRATHDGSAFCVGLADGQPCAVDDLCPHREAALSGGVVSDGVITCPGHFRRFDLRTGQCVGRPLESVGRYECEVIDGWVQAEIAPQAQKSSLRDVLLAHARGDNPRRAQGRQACSAGLVAQLNTVSVARPAQVESPASGGWRACRSGSR